MEGDWRKLKPSLGEAMSHLFLDSSSTDLTFKVGPEGCEDRWVGNGAALEVVRSVIDIPDTSPDSFRYLMKYFYTDELDAGLSTPDYLQLLRLAEQYQVPGLMSKCSGFLNSKIGVDNCVEIYQGTRLYQEKEVLISKIAYDFLTKNIVAVIAKKKFLQLDQQGLMQLLRSDNLAIGEVELFTAVMRWTNHEDQQVQLNPSLRLRPRKETLQALIPLLRFPIMEADRFAQVVVPTKVLTDAETVGIFQFFHGITTEGLRFSRTPRSFPPSKLKRLECYKDHRVLPVNPIQAINRHIVFPQFSFRCNMGITMHGLRLYGPEESSQSPNAKYEVQYTVSYTASLLYPNVILRHKELTIPVLTSGDFNLLLDKPLEMTPNMDYLVQLKVKIKDLRLPMPMPTSIDGRFIRSRFRIGKQMYADGGQMSSVEDGLVFTTTYVEPVRSTYNYGMVQSILYKL